MIDACLHMLARNSEDFIEDSLESVLPYVKRAIVCVDSRSNDKTKLILEGLKEKHSNLETHIFPVRDPLMDLTSARNFMLAKTTERFCWIVDSDEYYPKEVIIAVSNALEKEKGVVAFGLRSYPIWDKERYHYVTGQRWSMRIFRNVGNILWSGEFGRERLMFGNFDLCFDFRQIQSRYIHFTHVKSDNWRSEMGHERRIDKNNVALPELPEDIKSIVHKIYEKKL